MSGSARPSIAGGAVTIVTITSLPLLYIMLPMTARARPAPQIARASDLHAIRSPRRFGTRHELHVTDAVAAPAR